jgi:hypothetical protein
VLNAITNDEDLDRRFAERANRNQRLQGHYPTYHQKPEMPHDGFLADFLMHNKRIHPCYPIQTSAADILSNWVIIDRPPKFSNNVAIRCNQPRQALLELGEYFVCFNI